MSYIVPLSRACVYAALTAPADTIQIVITIDGIGDVVTFSNMCTNIKQYIR